MSFGYAPANASGSAAFVDLGIDDPRWEQALPVLQELRPHLTAADRRAVQAEGEGQGLVFTAVFADDVCLAVAGWRVMATTSVLRKAYVDDLVTAAPERSSGYGHVLLAELARRAREAGCHQLELDSGVQRFDAHRFYLRERMRINSHHFAMKLD